MELDDDASGVWESACLPLLLIRERLQLDAMEAALIRPIGETSGTRCEEHHVPLWCEYRRDVTLDRAARPAALVYAIQEQQSAPRHEGLAQESVTL